MTRSQLNRFSPPKARPQVELLEDRLTPSWAGVPPAVIAVPPSGTTDVTLNNLGDASGSAAITANEADFYRFTAQSTGSHTFAASRTSGGLDTVIGVFNSSGQRLAFNDDINFFNLNSRLTTSLTAGQTYYLGVSNYTGSG